jgi:hypothetical protein
VGEDRAGRAAEPDGADGVRFFVSLFDPSLFTSSTPRR